MTTMLGAALLIAAFMSSWPAAQSKALGYQDLLGGWCSATAKLTFTRATMTVRLFRDSSSVERKITRYEFHDSSVDVYWLDEDTHETSSTFGEFGKGGNQMFLQPADNVPHREYNHC